MPLNTVQHTVWAIVAVIVIVLGYHILRFYLGVPPLSEGAQDLIRKILGVE